MATTNKTTKTAKKTKKSSGAKTAKAKKAPKAGEELQAASAEAKPKAQAKPKKSEAKVQRHKMADRTYFARNEDSLSKWRVVDASGQTLGRLSSYIAMALMGKDKPSYTRSADTGDFVIVINAKDVKLTGRKLEQKTYNWHTGYPGGIKEVSVAELLATKPEKVIERAVYGMLPKGHMGRRWFKKLRVFAGPEHPHQAQQPQTVTLPNTR